MRTYCLKLFDDPQTSGAFFADIIELSTSKDRIPGHQTLVRNFISRYLVYKDTQEIREDEFIVDFEMLADLGKYLQYTIINPEQIKNDLLERIDFDLNGPELQFLTLQRASQYAEVLQEIFLSESHPHRYLAPVDWIKVVRSQLFN